MLELDRIKGAVILAVVVLMVIVFIPRVVDVNFVLINDILLSMVAGEETAQYYRGEFEYGYFWGMRLFFGFVLIIILVMVFRALREEGVI